MFKKPKVQRKNTKQEQKKHEPLKKLEEESGGMDSEHPLLTSHTHRLLFIIIGKTEQFVHNSVVKIDLTIVMKIVSHDST